MKDINGTIGNFEYGQYISRSQCYVIMLDALNMIMFGYEHFLEDTD